MPEPQPNPPRPGRFFAKAALAVLVLALVVLAGLWRHYRAGEEGKAKPRTATDLFSGREPKMAVRLYFVSADKGTLAVESRDIFRTASLVNQVKQVVLDLLKGPQEKGLAGVFPPGVQLKELFLGPDGLCVVDFSPEVQSLHPGGTTGEYMTLYCLVHSLAGNFAQIQRVQIMVDGQVVDSLAGHFDIAAPLTVNDF